ncbi:MAG: hypothetical protein ACHRXM_35240, partial [Isosphaerales bacterium]
IALGAALGGLAVYLYDPELGENRRGRLTSLWRENRDSALKAGRTASETIDSARPLARRITKAIGRGSWPVVVERGRRGTILPGLFGAAVIGGAVVYFMDPVKGSVRRMSALDAGHRAARQIVSIVEPVRGRVGDRVTDAADRFKSRAS